MNRLAVVVPQPEREAADKRTVEQAVQLQDLIQEELQRLQNQSRPKWKLGDDSGDRTGMLARLAAALKDAAATRLMALGGVGGEERNG